MSLARDRRTGPRVERGAPTLDEALDALEIHARAAANTDARPDVDVRFRRYEPGDQVAARAELRGTGACGRASTSAATAP